MCQRTRRRDAALAAVAVRQSEEARQRCAVERDAAVARAGASALQLQLSVASAAEQATKAAAEAEARLVELRCARKCESEAVSARDAYALELEVGQRAVREREATASRLERERAALETERFALEDSLRKALRENEKALCDLELARSDRDECVGPARLFWVVCSGAKKTLERERERERGLGVQKAQPPFV